MSGLLSAFTPDDPAVPLSVAAILVALILLILAWSAVIRRQHERIGAVVYARRPWMLVISGLAIAILVALPAFIRFNADTIWVLAAPLCLAALFFVSFLPTALRVWVAELDGLTSQTLAWRTTLAWKEIDWAYIYEKRTDIQELGVIKIAQTRERFLYVEAGPNRRMKIPISTWLAGDATPLVRAVEQRAAGAYFGADKQLDVERHRQGIIA